MSFCSVKRNLPNTIIHTLAQLQGIPRTRCFHYMSSFQHELIFSLLSFKNDLTINSGTNLNII